MKLWIAAAALALGGPAVAQQVAPQGPVIIVVGRGEASRPADFTEIHYRMFGEGKTEVEALQALSNMRAKVEGALTNLGNVRAINVDASGLTVDEVRANDCEGNQDRQRRSEGPCAVAGYVAVMSGTARVAPADQAGNAGSLAAEMGAVSVEVKDGGVLDPRSLEAEATPIALADALGQAQAVAQAQGARLGPVLRIQDNQARNEDSALDEIVVTAAVSRIRRPPRSCCP